MTYVSNDPAWWPVIYQARITSYFIVASLTAVVYDWALTFGQEHDHTVDLGQMRRWSLMTVLYICVRCLGILYSVYILKYIVFVSSDWCHAASLPFSITDEGCTILYFLWTWMPVVVNAMLGGELLGCGGLLKLSLLTYHASHYDDPDTCNVSAIQNDAHLPHCGLGDYHDRLRSHHSNSKHRGFRR
ncbi:hypothetical protein DFH29DRAFT_965639 [Suillus ampliporus]|nr:hypothetical protein DFH29DRAFT_965639 [Suillus ampliporus]